MSDFRHHLFLDKDTAGVPGSPAITSTILEKIDTCGLFLCDVTLVAETRKGKKSPNPNVLIELGYAVARLGWQRVICVMNVAAGGPEELPFDLQLHRWPIRYHLADDAEQDELRRQREWLRQEVAGAVRAAIASSALRANIDPKDQRVARKLCDALHELHTSVAFFLREHGLEEGLSMVQQDFPDDPATGFPSPDVVKPLIEVLVQHSLVSPSNVTVGEPGQVWEERERLSWLQVFQQTFESIMRDCDRILYQYSDRHDALISLVERIHDRVDVLAGIMRVTLSRPNFLDMYRQGMPENHQEWFAGFLVMVLKAYRVAREFGVDTSEY